MATHTRWRGLIYDSTIMSVGTDTSKPLIFVGSSQAEVAALPDDVADDIRTQLRLVQRNRRYTPPTAIPMAGDLAGVMEIRERLDGEAYRAYYIAKREDAVYVLYAFHKKSRKAREMPAPDRDRLKRRLRAAIESSERRLADQ